MSTKVLLEIKSVSKKFGENQVLDDCSFFLKKQEFVVLIGENGSGKSTLFNILTGVIKPDEGKIFLNGSNVKSKPIYTIAHSGVYRSFQDSRLFDNLTVLDHLLMVQDNADTKFLKNLLFHKNISRDKYKRAEEALDLLEIGNKKNTQISMLSYGQRKLVNLGMSFLTPQNVLLLDEVFAGVNVRLVDKIKKILIKIKKSKEKSIILITHDLQFAEEVADRVVYLRNGKISNLKEDLC